MAFLTNMVRKGRLYKRVSIETGVIESCEILVEMDPDKYDQCLCGIFTTTICEAKNQNQLLKAATMAEELGFKETEDFFMIKDNCLTELEPEEIDDLGIGRMLTCMGFRPLPDEIAHHMSRKYQLYKYGSFGVQLGNCLLSLPIKLASKRK